MKKCILATICLLVCGCSQNEGIDNKSLSELKSIVENNTKLIAELTDKNQILENQIVTLEEEKKNLTDEVKKLQESDTTINSNVDSKYNELKKLINNNQSSTNQYTITKNQLLGTWKYSDNSKITITDENLKIHGNWFEWKGMAFAYIYKDGKLFISDDGYVMTK